MKTQRQNLRPRAKPVGPPDFQIASAREQAYDVSGVKRGGKIRLTSKVFAVSAEAAKKQFALDSPSYEIDDVQPLQEWR